MEQLGYYANVDDDQEQNAMARLKAIPGNKAIASESQTCDQEHNQCKGEVATYRRLLEKDLSPGKRAEVLYDLVYALHDHGNLEEAIFHAEELLDAYPDYRYLDSVFWLLGVMYVTRASLPEHSETQAQDMAAAERNLRRALERIDDKEERAMVLVDLGVALSRSGKLADAHRAFEQALEIGIEDPVRRSSCYERLGWVLYRLDQVEQAQQCFEQAILVHPEKPNIFHARAYVDLAVLYRGQGDTARAEQCCQQARRAVDQSDPNAAAIVLGSIYEELGDISLHKEEHQQAIENYRLALQPQYLPENQADLFYKLGVALHWDGQYKKALESLRQALALELSSRSLNVERIGALLFHMGECAYSLHDFQQAIVLLKEATEKIDLPELAEVHLSLGHSYFRLKRFNNAAEFYGKVIRETKLFSPNWRQAMKYLVWARIAR